MGRWWEEIVVIPMKPNENSAAAGLPFTVVVGLAPALGWTGMVGPIGVEASKQNFPFGRILIHAYPLVPIATGRGFKTYVIGQDETFPIGNVTTTVSASHEEHPLKVKDTFAWDAPGS
jgi:hypothetical protein